MTREERLASGALLGLVAVTVAWWALALWPVPPGAAEWVARAREVCFGTAATGLPDAGGWLLLIGQPIGMAVAMFVVWGDVLSSALRRLGRTTVGRLALAGVLALLLAGSAGATVRVLTAGPAPVVLDDPRLPPETYPRLDREAPGLDLIDQQGHRIDLGRFRGRPLLLTFAFGQCDAICPVVVRNVLEAAGAVPELDAAVAVVTLDPWRDTPARLPHIAEQWGLGTDAYLLGGAVAEVEATLDAWNMARDRNPYTGDISHPPLVYIVDGEGTIAFATTGDPLSIVTLLGRL